MSAPTEFPHPTRGDVRPYEASENFPSCVGGDAHIAPWARADSPGTSVKTVRTAGSMWASTPTDPIAAHKKRHPFGWRFFMEWGTGILRRLCRLRAVSAIVLTFGQNRRYFIPLPVLRPKLPDGRTTGSLRDPCSKNQHPSFRWVLIFGAGYGNRTRLCGLGSDRSTDELTPRSIVLLL